MRSPPSLRRNLLLHTLVGVALVWCAMAAWVFWDAEHEVEELLDAHLAQVAALLMVRHGDGGLADAQERRSPPILHEYGTSVAYQVFDGERGDRCVQLFLGGLEHRRPGPEHDVLIGVAVLEASRLTIRSL